MEHLIMIKLFNEYVSKKDFSLSRLKSFLQKMNLLAKRTGCLIQACFKSVFHSVLLRDWRGMLSMKLRDIGKHSIQLSGQF